MRGHLSSLIFMPPAWIGDAGSDSAKSQHLSAHSPLSPNGQASTLKFSPSVGFCRELKEDQAAFGFQDVVIPFVFCISEELLIVEAWPLWL